MAGVKPVSFVTPGFDYAADQAEIDRRRRLAELLQAQGMAPGGGTETVGGWAIKKSPLEGAGKVAQSYFGSLASKQADELSKQMRERQAGDFTSDRSALVAAMRGRPADQGVDDPTAGYAAPSAAQPPNPQAMEQLNFRSPMFQQLQMQQLAAQLQPPKYHVVGGSLVPEPRMGQQGQVAAAFTAPKMHALSPGQQLVPEPAPGIPGAAPAQVKPVYSAPDKDEAAKFNAILEGAGIPPDSPAGQQLFKALALKTATHQPATTVTTNVSTEKKYGEQFAGQIAKADSEMRDAAIKAPQLAERSNQLKKLLQGNVITGTGAEFRLSLAKAAQLAGIGGGTAADTEQLSVSMAQNTLDAIKASGLGSGSGFSNADRDFLEKAVGGKITLQKDTIDRLATLAHKASSETAKKWNTRVREIPRSALDGTGIGQQPIQVPALFGAAPAAQQSDPLGIR